MTELLIWANFLIASALGLWRASRIDVGRLSFADGLLIGMLYYLSLPMLFILIDGSISSQFIMSEDYYPYRDLDTTLTIISCLYFAPLLHCVLPGTPGRAMPAGERPAERLLLQLLLVMYFVSTVGGFLLSGLWAGGHWYTSAHSTLSSSGLALGLKHLAGFSRTAIFAVLLYHAAMGAISRRSFYVIGGLVVVADLLLTFNRITAAYMLISILLLNRRRAVVAAAVMASLIFVIPAISNMWPMFRSLATRDGYTLEGMLAAAEMAFRTATAHGGLADFTSGVFESINIPVLNYIVHNQGDALQVTPGSFYLRPATIFLPTMIWDDRPQGFGSILGSVINNSSNGLALNSTLIGEPYGNFGVWWPLGVLPMYLVYHLLFRQLALRSPSFGAIGAFCALAMWRFDSTTPAIGAVLCLLMLWSVRILRSMGRTGTDAAVRQ